MNTAELKINIINRITKLKDAHIIEEIQQLLDFELEKEMFSLSPEQKHRISEAQKEYSKGKILSEKEANDDIGLWLNEK